MDLTNKVLKWEDKDGNDKLKKEELEKSMMDQMMEMYAKTQPIVVKSAITSSSVTHDRGYMAFGSIESESNSGEMKTIIEWVDELEDATISENFSRAILKQRINSLKKVKSLYSAINSMSWYDTDEGADYWSQIANNY